MANTVGHIIAVASGKGGVGKSTVTANLALAMAARGKRVGVLDADIYGPSQAHMLGVDPQTRPDMIDDKTMRPVDAHGLRVMSIAFLVDVTTPMVWRGPMASTAFQQLYNQTQWGELDYLFIDMPPGTGDIQLTLAQKVPVSGAVIVTTPQDIALLDAERGIEMFRKVHVPVLGIVENMSFHTCSCCGHQEAIFGEGGGQRIAERYNAPVLGRLPLALSVREQMDKGVPPVIAAPDQPAAQHFASIVAQLDEACQAQPEASGPTIGFS
ncbi:iron-sulfur cluster carrier protein ApbC [Zymobacter palmae]|uniref:Iron-sulfur cluster carrier protein n=1 Tax=Zymobacter palmae TaxID=33074 RepID=A0A348HDP4_9GAMM|nr:iron-sulfur cluster carrier protein ApbC [Zymobacter palmae]BBG29746.1 ATPase [Zymobacter palmae]